MATRSDLHLLARFPHAIAARSIPECNPPPGVADKIAANYYHLRLEHWPPSQSLAGLAVGLN